MTTDPKSAKRGMPDGTPEAEYERAMYHGPDTRTVDALRDAIKRYEAAEADFIQVHKNTVKIDERRIEAERELADCKAELERNRPGCPCTVEGIEPCKSSCSCANWTMSGGCSRCARYGSKEQRFKAAQSLVARLAAHAEREEAYRLTAVEAKMLYEGGMPNGIRLTLHPAPSAASGLASELDKLLNELQGATSGYEMAGTGESVQIDAECNEIKAKIHALLRSHQAPVGDGE